MGSEDLNTRGLSPQVLKELAEPAEMVYEDYERSLWDTV